jgi:hypothetical protein
MENRVRNFIVALPSKPFLIFEQTFSHRIRLLSSAIAWLTLQRLGYFIPELLVEL